MNNVKQIREELGMQKPTQTTPGLKEDTNLPAQSCPPHSLADVITAALRHGKVVHRKSNGSGVS